MTVTAAPIPRKGEQYMQGGPHVVRRYLYASDASDCGTYDLFAVASGVWVQEIRTNVNTAFTASVAIDIGDSDDDDGWVSYGLCAATTAVTSGAYKSSLTTDSAANAYGIAHGKIYTSTQAIQAKVWGAAPSAGELEILCQYVVLEV